MAFETFDLGRVLQTAEAIKAMKDDSVTRKLQQQYMQTGEARAQAQDQRAQGMYDMQTQAHNNQQSQFNQEQQIKNTRYSNAFFKMMAEDPSTAPYAVEQMKALGIVQPDFDISGKSPEEIKAASAKQYEETTRLLQTLSPQAPIKLGSGEKLLDAYTRQEIASNQKAEKPISVSPGATLIDPDTGQPIYTNPNKSGTTVNVNAPYDDARLKSQQEELGKALVKDLYVAAKAEARGALKTNQKLALMERLLDNGLKTGKFTAFLSEGANFLTSMGLAPETAKEFARDAQTFNAAAMDLVLQAQMLQKGPQTEPDAKRLEASVAGVEKTDDANRLLIAFAKAQNNRNIQFSQFLDKWAKDNNGDLYGAEEAWTNGPGAKSLFDDPVLKKYENIGSKANRPRATNPQTGEAVEWDGKSWVRAQ